jgi:hypothetical protein
VNAQVSPSRSPRIDYERQLARDIGACVRDPLKYALYNWPGLELRQWQVEDLQQIGAQLKDKPYEPILSAKASGHGIGKGCEGAILAHWAMSTREMTRGVVTANTDGQLRTKTWPELAKWHSLARNKHWFTCTATALYHPDYEKNWRLDAIPWSEHNTEAFAGLHNKGHRILVWFDEASAIHDKVWEVTEGALTDENTEILWIVRGNPTRTTGRFKECFGRFQHRWMTGHIDARHVEGTNKVQIQKWVDDYGEDSDFVRVRVRGMFPSASSMQFIEADVVQQAMRREPIAGIRDPLIMGVDIARGGDDRFVIAYRRGLDGQSIPPIVIPGSETRDSMRMVTKVVDLATTTDRRLRPDAIIVDETGVGGPIVDRLRQILGDTAQVYGVNFASASPDPKLANMRAYMWSRMRDWLRLGGALPNDPEIESDLCGVEYYHDKRDRLILESKDDLKARGLASCDIGDGYGLTHAIAIQPREITNVIAQGARCLTDYDPYSR